MPSVEILLLLPIGFVGSVFWFVSAEGSAMYYGSQGYHPALVGFLAALGQCTMYIILYHGGVRLVDRWQWLAKKVAVLHERYQQRLTKGYLSVSGIASISGIPPLVALMTLGSAFGARFWHLWPIALTGRTVRFTILAAVGEELIAWWNGWTGCG